MRATLFVCPFLQPVILNVARSSFVLFSSLIESVCFAITGKPASDTVLAFVCSFAWQALELHSTDNTGSFLGVSKQHFFLSQGNKLMGFITFVITINAAVSTILAS
jgi:hypothetical protein